MMVMIVMVVVVMMVVPWLQKVGSNGATLLQSLKPVFHFNHIVTYRSIFFCVEVISSTLVVRKQRNTLRYDTVEVENQLKAGFPLRPYRTETYW